MSHVLEHFGLGRPDAHDGAPRCVLCGGTEPAADYEWCAAAHSLVCDSCCQGVLSGEPNRVATVATTGYVMCSESLFETCSQCHRSHGRLVDDQPEEPAHGVDPC